MATTATAMTQQQNENKQPVILQYLDRYKSQIAAALPSHMTPDRMARIVTTEVRKVPQLLQCNPTSLFGAVIQASQLGLEPGGALGHCYLIPFKRDVQLIIGYRGMIDLARRSGQIISIEARAVYEGDAFSYSFGLEPDLKHTPSTDAKGALTHVYAVARLKDGGIQWDVMTRSEVEAIRAQSKAGGSGPWKTHFDEMAKKTVVRRLFKYLPVSIEIQRAVGLDEQADAGISQQSGALIDGEFLDLGGSDEQEQPSTRTESIKNKLAGNAAPESSDQASDIDADDLILQLKSAQDFDALESAADLIRELKGEDKKRAQAAYQARVQELKDAE